MEFRVFRFKLSKTFQDFSQLKTSFEKKLENETKRFLKIKARIVDEEEQKREKTAREKIYELIFKNYLEGICKYKFLSDNFLVLTFYTEKEDKRKGISPFYRRYNERGVCNKCPPEVTKKIFIFFKNPKEGIIFINGGNPKATNFILEQKIPRVIPIKISNELKYSSSKVAELFNKFNREEIVDSINDMQVAVKIKRQDEFIYKTLVFKEVGSFEEYQKLAEKHLDIKVNKFSVNVNILNENKKVKLTFRSMSDLNPIGTSLKSRAYDSYVKLFSWLGNLLVESPSQ